MPEFRTSTSEHSYYSGTTPKLFNIERIRKTLCDPSSKERTIRGAQPQNIPDIGMSKDFKTVCNKIKKNALKMKKIYIYMRNLSKWENLNMSEMKILELTNTVHKMFIGLLVKYKQSKLINENYPISRRKKN